MKKGCQNDFHKTSIKHLKMKSYATCQLISAVLLWYWWKFSFYSVCWVWTRLVLLAIMEWVIYFSKCWNYEIWIIFSKEKNDQTKNMMEIKNIFMEPLLLKGFIEIFFSKLWALLRCKNEKLRFWKKAKKPKNRNRHAFYNGTINSK